jgi:hypothetical protein
MKKQLRIVIEDGNIIVDSAVSEISDEYHKRAVILIKNYYNNYIPDIIDCDGYALAEFSDGKFISHQIKNIPQSLIDLIHSRR